MTAIVVAAFVVVALGNGIGPVYASHCHEDDKDLYEDDGYDTMSDCHDEDVYESNGNYKCSETEKLTDGDLDGDGTDDCDDADDDGDHLSDRLEREDYVPSHYRDKNSDDGLSDDGLDDGQDIVPTQVDGATATIRLDTYDPPTDDCGDRPGAGRPDPYVPDGDGEFEISYGTGDLDLVPPQGWEEDYTNDVPNDGDDNDDAQDGRAFEDGHIHNRPPGDVNDFALDDGDSNWANGNVSENVTKLPDDIEVYPGDEPNGIPRITLRVGLKDHDVENVDAHDRMDISEEGGESILEFDGDQAYPLTYDPANHNGNPLFQDETGNGDGSCNATVGFTFEDSADATAVRAAVYHRDTDDAVVQTSDL